MEHKDDSSSDGSFLDSPTSARKPTKETKDGKEGTNRPKGTAVFIIYIPIHPIDREEQIPLETPIVQLTEPTANSPAVK